tara:strand:+ start:218 stop:358 length:141 start_codon:yes stop_codon:yes gene_type:complete
MQVWTIENIRLKGITAKISRVILKTVTIIIIYFLDFGVSSESTEST